MYQMTKKRSKWVDSEDAKMHDFSRYYDICAFARVFTSIADQMKSGKKQFVVKREGLEQLGSEKSLYYELIWGHTEDGKEGGITDPEDPIVNETTDETVYRIKDPLSETDIRYFIERLQRHVHEYEWWTEYIKKTYTDEEIERFTLLTEKKYKTRNEE